MVEIDFKIVIAGFICLTAIIITLILCNKSSETIVSLGVGILALGMGIVIPSPRIDNKNGVLKW